VKDAEQKVQTELFFIPWCWRGTSNSYCYPLQHDRATHMLVMLLLVLVP